MSNAREEADRIIRCRHCDGTGWLEPIGPCTDGSYITSRGCTKCDDDGRPRTKDLRDAIEAALLAERRRGEDSMRERAALYVETYDGPALADGIRALPGDAT